MTQSTGGYTFRDVKIEFDLSSAGSWTDISGYSSSLEIDGGERNIGEFFTGDGDTPILGAGKRTMLNVTAKVLSTEGDTEPQEVLEAAYEAGTPIQLRWSPKGGSSGQRQFTTAVGYITAPIYPQGEVETGDPVAFELAIATPSIAGADIT